MNHLDGDDNTGEEDTPETRDLSITVTDGENGISGVTVAIGETTGITGSAGGCTLSNIPDGEHTIIATKEGYVDYTSTVTTGADNTSITIVLTANGG